MPKYLVSALALLQIGVGAFYPSAHAQDPEPVETRDEAFNSVDNDVQNREPASHHLARQQTPKRSQGRLVISGLAGFDMMSSGNQSASQPSFGLTVGYTLSPVWTAGISAVMASSTPDDVGLAGGATSTLNVFTAMLDYHFPGLESMYAGLRLGTALRTSSFATPLAGSASTFGFAFQVLGGWNFQIIDALALSPQVGYMRAQTAVPTTDIQIQLAIRYWPGFL